MLQPYLRVAYPGGHPNTPESGSISLMIANPTIGSMIKKTEESSQADTPGQLSEAQEQSVAAASGSTVTKEEVIRS